MKGRISKTLESILHNPRARRELRGHLIRGRDGQVQLNGKTYRIRIDVTFNSKHASGGRTLLEA